MQNSCEIYFFSHLRHLIDGADAQDRQVERHIDLLLAEPRPDLAVVPRRVEKHVERLRDRLGQLLPSAANFETAKDTINEFGLQGPANKLRPGLVNFVTTVAYHFCLSLPAAFTQPGALYSSTKE